MRSHCSGTRPLRPLLLALRVLLGSARDPRTRLMACSPHRWESVDGMGVRRPGSSSPPSGGKSPELAGSGLPRLSVEWVAAALRDPELLADSPPSRDTAGHRTADVTAGLGARS